MSNTRRDRRHHTQHYSSFANTSARFRLAREAPVLPPNKRRRADEKRDELRQQLDLQYNDFNAQTHTDDHDQDITANLEEENDMNQIHYSITNPMNSSVEYEHNDQSAWLKGHEHGRETINADLAFVHELSSEENGQSQLEDRMILPVQDGGESNDTEAVVKLLRRRMNKLLSWNNMFSYLAVTGNVSLNAEQYGLLRDALNHSSGNLFILTYKTVRSTLTRLLMDISFPPSSLKHITDIQHARPIRRNGRLVDTINEGLKDPRNCARIVSPSEWAKLDVCTYPLYADMYEHPKRSAPDFMSIENTPIVQERRRALRGDSLWVHDKNSIFPSRLGDLIDIPTSLRPQRINGVDIEELGWEVHEDPCHGPHSDCVLITGTVGKSWCVKSSTNTDTVRSTNMVGSGFESIGSSANEKNVYEQIRQSKWTSRKFSEGRDNFRNGSSIRNRHLMQRRRDIIVKPGDVCVFIGKVPTACTSDIVCVLVASFANLEPGTPAEQLYWIDAKKVSADHALNYEVHTAVTGVPILRSDSGSISGFELKNRCLNKGVLDDGCPFVVYRMALYADGFKQHKSLSNTKSVYGCYMMPLSLSQEARRSPTAVRILSIVPDGQPANTVLREIIDDVVEAAVYGVDGMDPYGNNVKIFLDPVSFFGDYPAISSVSDVMGHTADAFCTMCTIRKKKGERSSECMYTTEVHSRRLAYCRFDERLEAIREHGISKRVRIELGMKTSTEEEACTLPNVYLSRRLAEMKYAVRKTNGGAPVNELLFDSCLNAAAAPDHLLTGVTKNVVRLCFEAIPNDLERKRVELLIIDAASSNGLETDGNIIRWNKKTGIYNGLNSMRMSTLYNILLCAATILKQVRDNGGDERFLIPTKLQRLVSKLFWWPSVGTDASEDINCAREQKKNGELMKTAVDFVKSADACVRKFGAAANMLDVPNGHRILELCVHTIPILGHARICSELVLEMAHRGVKSWLELNTHDNAHITAMEKALGRDWVARVSVLYKCWEEGTEEARSCAEVGLRRLFLGTAALTVNNTFTGVQDLFEAFRDKLSTEFKEPVTSQLMSCTQIPVPWEKRHGWEAADKFKSTDKSYMFITGSNALKLNFPLLQDINSFKRARYVNVDSLGRRRRTWGFKKVSIGDALSVLIEDTEINVDIFPRTSNGTGRLEVFVIGSIIKCGEEEVWFFVHRMEKINGKHKVTSNRVLLLPAHEGVRRVALIHACNDRCKVSLENMTVRHSESALRGGLYNVISRMDGYPPHQG